MDLWLNNLSVVGKILVFKILIIVFVVVNGLLNVNIIDLLNLGFGISFNEIWVVIFKVFLELINKFSKL